MKKYTLLLLIIVSISLPSLIACGGDKIKTETPAEITKEQYQCPMKCTEGVFDKAGACSVCGMDLEKITKS
jgi:hypothetical protein